MMHAPEIRQFIDRVLARLNRGEARRVAAWAMIGAASASLVWAIAWRIPGYAAPRWGYPLAVVCALIAGGVMYFSRRREAREAAGRADVNFGLKDGLISWLDFQDRSEERVAFALHERLMERKVAGLKVEEIALPEVRKPFLIGGVMAVVAIVLSLMPHSEAVRKRLAQEEMTLERTAEISREMEEAVEEIIRELSEEERELIDVNKLREWSKEIEQTKDAREAEKQLAKIEQQIAQTMQGLEARQDEAVLKMAAGELEKSSASDLRQLGKQLDAKDFDQAAEQLKEMKNAAKDKLTPEEMKKLRENAAKTKEMAKRMADGAKKRDFGKAKGNEGKMGAMKPSAGKQRPMQDMLNDLDAKARAMDAEMADGGEMDDDLQDAMEMMDGELDELGKRLGKLGAREKAKGKMKALRQGMAGARQFAQGRSQSLGLAQSQQQGPGGRKAGVGSVESRRNERDELKDNGNRAEVKGQDNPDGPSTSSVETAESGTGVSGRAEVAKEREFKQQYESLVRRDDIPESLKLGVKEYFEKVHETGEEK